MGKVLFLILIPGMVQLSAAQEFTRSIEMTDAQWDVNEETFFEFFDNRQTVLLKRGRISVKDLSFSNGTLEVEVYANEKRSFAGIFFRKNESNMEEIYLRMHKSKQVDAVQYTPIFNDESNWQLYREYQAQVSFDREGWNKLKIEVENQTATVFVNDRKVLFVDDLRTDQQAGEIGLFALFGNRFSNFKVTKSTEAGLQKKATESPSDPEIISEWMITEAKTYDGNPVNPNDFADEDYTVVKTERSGLLPISKYVKKSGHGSFEQNPEDYVVATTILVSEKEVTKVFSFDYSDRIMIYLNGQLLFEGDNSFRIKGSQFQGHVDINANKLYLPLKKGSNEIHCVVIDRANGWGLMAKVETK